MGNRFDTFGDAPAFDVLNAFDHALRPGQGSTQDPSFETVGVAIKAESIRVLTGRIICEVRIVDQVWTYSTPELMQVLCKTFPELPHHACVNQKGRTFKAVMNHTSLAHVLEHLIISVQVRKSSDKAASFQGTTEWVDEMQGRARVQVSYHDDLLALRAFNEALTYVNNAVLICSA